MYVLVLASSPRMLFGFPQSLVQFANFIPAPLFLGKTFLKGLDGTCRNLGFQNQYFAICSLVCSVQFLLDLTCRNHEVGA